MCAAIDREFRTVPHDPVQSSCQPQYLFPSTVWNELNKLFTDSAIKHPEYGISLNGETIHLLKDEFAFEKQIREI